MDLTSLDTTVASNEGAWMEVLHPETRMPLVDEPTGKPVRIKVAGIDGKLARQASRESQQRRLAKRSITADTMEEENLHMLARLTLAWEGVVCDGEALACTYDNAKKLYDRFRWLYLQVDSFSVDRGNYLGNS